MGTRPPAAGVQTSLRDRAIARLIDTGIVAVVAGAAGLPSGFGLPWLVATMVGVYAYFVLPLVAFAATPGKRARGLVVVGGRGQRPSLREAALREAFVLLGAVPFAGPVLAIAAWIAIARSIRADAAGRGIHDRLAGGTMVRSLSLTGGPNVPA